MRSVRNPPLSTTDTPVVDALSRWLIGRALSTAGSMPKDLSQLETLAPEFAAQGVPTSPKTPSISDRETPAAASSVDAPSAAEGSRSLGRYRILRQLGAGGMGVVHLAFDPHLKRQVALKVIHPRHGDNPRAAEKFVEEARALALVESDHIVTVYDIGDDRGVVYLAMPLLHGESLEARLQRLGRLPVSEVLRITRDIARGLAAAHTRGLIHRDIKPSNVWLEEVSGGVVSGEWSDSAAKPSAATHHSPLTTHHSLPRVKILDFGLACMNTDLEASSHVSGTPAYMAPEQATGHPVDGRADLFSLGCVTYYMAVGTPPFTSKDVISTILQVATEEPPAPRQVNPRCPRSWKR